MKKAIIPSLKINAVGLPFFEREGGKQIRKLVEKGAIRSLAVWAIDRLGRDLLDILNTIHYFN